VATEKIMQYGSKNLLLKIYGNYNNALPQEKGTSFTKYCYCMYSVTATIWKYFRG
jgi:hypothetical protein